MAVDVGFPVNSGDLEKARDNVLAGNSPAGRALRLLYVGPYSGLNAAYRRLENAIKAASLVPSGRTWEVYLKGPGTPAESAFETEIYMQVASPK